MSVSICTTRIKLSLWPMLTLLYRALPYSALFCCLMSCEADVRYTQSQVSIDLNPCLTLLKFDELGGCGTHWGTSREGCLVIRNHLNQTLSLPVRFDPEGLIPINGQSDLTGDLVFNPEEGGAFSIFLFASEHEGTPNRCDHLRIDSSCDGECRLSITEEPISLSDDNGSSAFIAGRCQWKTAEESEPLEMFCDEIDNDCDGKIDELEGQPQIGDTCTLEVGACISGGVYRCLDGIGAPPSCDAAIIEMRDELCDERDNDCDGEVDEGLNVGASCQALQGICEEMGALRCVSEEDLTRQPELVLGETVCQLNERNPELRKVERELGVECNGLDDDCDGFVDEHFTPRLDTCGEGACIVSQPNICQDGEVVTLCSPGEPVSDDSNCDLIDDDCDGVIDESYVPSQRQCGVGACKSMGLVICTPSGEESVCTPNPPPGLDDDCDGIDDDCDGTPDDAYMPTEVECGVGACRATGVRRCVNGYLINDCTPQDPEVDQTCDGVDDDCDGRTDESYTPTSTTCGAGVCRSTGRLLCVSGDSLDTCIPTAPLSGIDLCDGFDYDCDGDVDEDHLSTLTTCGQGDCRASGNIECVSGQLFDTCIPRLVPARDFDEACDLRDSDCDGRVDEGYDGDVVVCGEGACAAEGVKICVNGDDTNDTCIANDATEVDDICDDIDQDCDGLIDEAYVSRVTSCGLNACQRAGQTSCVEGQELDSCVAGQPQGRDATCDRIDSDCDGRFDEGYSVIATTCGFGVCTRQGLQTCSQGEEVDTCSVGSSTGGDDQCDGVDQDCDGQADEGYQEIVTTCGVGSCRSTGLEFCSNGQLEETCTPSSSNLNDRRCDGVDDDCDGRVDEGYTSREVFCGVGACLRAGQRDCVEGVELDLCTAGQAALNDQTCDFIDDDCDGEIDEGYISMEVTCGVGSCTNAGQLICTYQGLENTCVDTAADQDLACNGIDDDCDGAIDEDYQPPMDGGVMISCGEGACRNTSGVLVCEGGSVQTTCEELPSPGADDTCNGIDEDCDGLVDEHYSMVSRCGEGECRQNSEVVCVNQELIDLCEPSDPLSDFDLCGEQKDNNCDGEIREYLIGDVCTSDFNSCSAIGQYICNELRDGVVCDAEIPTPEIERCDDVDNDCDGRVDEEVMYTDLNCFNNSVFGTCQNGLKSCEDGLTVCQPSAPLPDEVSCNNADEDCDGQVDEERVDGELRMPKVSCSSGRRCKWRCHGEGPLTCSRRNGNLCSRD